MVREYEASFPSTIVRFAALFSDWCEYPPSLCSCRLALPRPGTAASSGGAASPPFPTCT